MTLDTSLPMLKALLRLSGPSDRDVDLKVLQARIEGALTNLYANKDHEFPLAIAIFLKDERRRIVFYAGFSPDKRQRELNLQILPHIGTEYASAPKDLIDRSAEYSAVIAERVHAVHRATNTTHQYRCTPIDKGKKRFAATLNEPQDYFKLSRDAFFKRLLVSTFRIPWPHSESELLISVFFSLTGRDDDAWTLAAARDATLGPVVGQLFLSVALAQTALADLTPLIADLQAKSWSRTLREDADQLWEGGFENALYTQVLHLGRTSPFPFSAVMREILEVPVARKRFSDWLSSHDDLVGALSEIDPSALAALAAVYPDLPLAAAAKKAMKKDRKRALQIAGSLSEMNSGLAVEVATLKSPNTSPASPSERHQSYGIALASLLSPSADRKTATAAWRLFEGVLKTAADDERKAMAVMASALVLGIRKELREELYERLQKHASDTEAHEIDDVFAGQEQLRTTRVRDGLPHLVTVLSQKGGVGKTTLALATARHLARRHRVCLVELDFAGPTLHNYKELAGIPYVNPFFEDREDLEIGPVLLKRTVVDRLSVWPADPNWLSTQGATRHARSDLQRIVEFEAITRLLGALSAFDVVVLDTPAEVKYVTRTAAFATSVRRGTLLLSASMFGPSYVPLIEQYWRIMHAPGVNAALVLNKIRGVDRLPTRSRAAFLDWLLTSREVPLHAFGMTLESAPLLKAFFPASMPLIAIENSETVERATRQQLMKTALASTENDGFGNLRWFLDHCKMGKARR